MNGLDNDGVMEMRKLCYVFYKCCDGCRKLLNKLKKYGTISLEIWIYENMILYLICDGFRHMERS